MATPAPVQLQLPLTVSGLVFLCICLWHNMTFASEKFSSHMSYQRPIKLTCDSSPKFLFMFVEDKNISQTSQLFSYKSLQGLLLLDQSWLQSNGFCIQNTSLVAGYFYSPTLLLKELWTVNVKFCNLLLKLLLRYFLFVSVDNWKDLWQYFAETSANFL